MKFAHIADCHIGAWKEEKLRELNIKTFKAAIEICINENVNFILICGDLFDSVLPPINLIKDVVRLLKQLKDNNIPCYVIAGSHDFSLTGKTMLKVFEEADLVKDVANNGFVTDKTGVKIAGLYGKKTSLEIEDYKKLNKDLLESESGFKIFMFHTALNEFKPEPEIQGMECTNLPKNFSYYAGGHVHYIFDIIKNEYGRIVYPGALFPNNFKELWDFKSGGFFIFENNNLIYKKIILKDTLNIEIDISNKSIYEIREELFNLKDYEDKILLLKFMGELNGSISGLKLNEITFKNAFVVLKNLSRIKTKEAKEVILKEENIEEQLIEEYNTEFKDLIKDLMIILDKEKEEGEKNIDFEKRIIEEATKHLNLFN